MRPVFLKDAPFIEMLNRFSALRQREEKSADAPLNGKDYDIALSCLFEAMGALLSACLEICDEQSPHAVRVTREAMLAIQSAASYYLDVAQRMPDDRPIIGKGKPEQRQEILDALAEIRAYTEKLDKIYGRLGNE